MDAILIAGGDMPKAARTQTDDERFCHSVNEFATGVQLMADLENEKVDVGGLVKELVLAMQSQARTKPHPLLYVNMGLLLTVVFSAGVMWQRVNELEGRIHSMQGTEVIASQLAEVKGEVGRLRDRVDALIERGDRLGVRR